MSRKSKEASAENGKLGGRPVSDATLRTQAARDYISLQLADSLPPIVAKAITQAMEGNSDARNWLSDRAWGRPKQEMGFTDSEGSDVAVIANPIMTAIAREYEEKLKNVI
jgi:hypothetical protein